MSSLLELDDLHHPSGLHGVSLALAPGEVLALVGSHGNGKEPLLQLLTGVGRPERGCIRIGGHDPHRPEAAAQVGVAGPLWGLNPLHTVWQTLELFAGLWSVPRGRVEELAEALDLFAVGTRLAADLSPGETARLRLGRALLHNPALVVLDEPIGDIDVESTVIIESVISTAAEEGKGVLITTFGHPRTLRLATRVLYMEHGRLVEAAEPLALVVGATPADEAPPVVGGAPARPRVDQIAARRDDRVILFSSGEIRYAYAQGKGVYLHTAEGDWTVTFTLAELEERLATQGFFRAHRGYLVNLAQVREIATWTRSSFSLRLKDGDEIPLSKHRVAELKELLGW